MVGPSGSAGPSKLGRPGERESSEVRSFRSVGAESEDFSVAEEESWCEVDEDTDPRVECRCCWWVCSGWNAEAGMVDLM